MQSLKNKEYEMEEKKEREKFEKRVGILNYLVDKDSMCISKNSFFLFFFYLLFFFKGGNHILRKTN